VPARGVRRGPRPDRRAHAGPPPDARARGRRRHRMWRSGWTS
jgi:hypothetical protein